MAELGSSLHSPLTHRNCAAAREQQSVPFFCTNRHSWRGKKRGHGKTVAGSDFTHSLSQRSDGTTLHNARRTDRDPWANRRTKTTTYLLWKKWYFLKREGYNNKKSKTKKQKQRKNVRGKPWERSTRTAGGGGARGEASVQKKTTCTVLFTLCKNKKG